MKTISSNLTTPAPLFHRFWGQSQAQPAYIELDCREGGKLSADYSCEYGNATPCYVWHRLAERFDIPSASTRDSLLVILTDDDFLALCQTVVDGFEEFWDGSNWVGQYTPDARYALEEIADYLDSHIETAEVWGAEQWLFSNCSLSDVWGTGQSLDDAVAAMESEAISQGIVIDGDIREAILGHARSHEDELTEAQREALLAE
jgi:hypothetical protein